MRLSFEQVRRIGRYLVREEYATPEHWHYLNNVLEISHLNALKKRGNEFELRPYESLEDFCIVIPLKKHPPENLFKTEYETVRIFYEIRNKELKNKKTGRLPAKNELQP